MTEGEEGGEEEEEDVKVPQTPLPQEWVCLGSDLEILEQQVTNSRELVSGGMHGGQEEEGWHCRREAAVGRDQTVCIILPGVSSTCTLTAQLYYTVYLTISRSYLCVSGLCGLLLGHQELSPLPCEPLNFCFFECHVLTALQRS